MRKNKKVLGIIALIAVMGLLFACGGDGGSNTDPGGTDDPGTGVGGGAFYPGSKAPSGGPVDNPNAVTGVSLNKVTAGVVTGSTLQLSAVVWPDNAANKNVTWSSSADTVATVSTTGLVTAVAEGGATITVTTEDGAKIATCAITVSDDPVLATGITITELPFELITTQKRLMTAIISPLDATQQAITWSSSDGTVATVDPATGEVTAVAVGTAIITATVTDTSFTDTCTVTVKDPPAPVAADFVATGLDQTDLATLVDVEIGHKTGFSQGEITHVYYTGVRGTTYTENETLPSKAGYYQVTFDVGPDGARFSKAEDLVAGILSLDGTVETDDFATLTTAENNASNGDFAAPGTMAVSGVTKDGDTITLTVGGAPAKNGYGDVEGQALGPDNTPLPIWYFGGMSSTNDGFGDGEKWTWLLVPGIVVKGENPKSIKISSEGYNLYPGIAADHPTIHDFRLTSVYIGGGTRAGGTFADDSLFVIPIKEADVDKKVIVEKTFFDTTDVVTIEIDFSGIDWDSVTLP